ncbi:Cell wall assembly regulator [Cystobasidiomycetes sp. EMM_F5]
MLSSLGALFGRSSTSATPSGQHRQAAATSSYQVDAGDVESGAGASYPPRSGGQHSYASRPDLVVPLNAPAPRAKHSLARIRSLVRKIRPELNDTLSYGASKQSIAELQQALKDYILPRDVVEAYQVADGQDSFSVPGSGENEEVEGAQGYIYGLWWMSIEEVLEEYRFWRRLDISTPPSPVVHKRAHPFADVKGKGRQQSHNPRMPSTDAFLFGSEMDPRTVRGRMTSCPEGFVREEYSHPSWLPLLKDGYGNYIGVDLDPPTLSDEQIAALPQGVPRILPGRGQVIAFGREIDVKTVLWNGWADNSAYDANIGGGWARFLASFADDLSATTSRRRDEAGYGSPDDYDDDESAYRNSSGGRQESSDTHRKRQGMEWTYDSPIFSGMNTIEALVERSKRHWADFGMYTEEGEDDNENVVLNGNSPSRREVQNNAFHAGINGAGTLDRQSKPSPLQLQPLSDIQSNTGRTLLARQPSSTAAVEETDLQNLATPQNDRFPIDPDKTPQSGVTHKIQASAADAEDTDNLDAMRSTTALVNPINSDAVPAPASPEPSLLLSPPSPNDPLHAVQSLSTQQAASPGQYYQDNVTSPPRPTSGGLQSPARFSPAQAHRFAMRQSERDYHRNRSSESIAGTPTNTNARSPRQAAPPPPVMPLGLPTLDFGQGLWEQQDTAAFHPSKSSFEVVVDRR